MIKLKLTTKISLITLFSIIISIGVLGFYFDEFLKTIYFEDAKHRIDNAKEKIYFDIKNKESDLIKGVSFIKDDKAMIASISLINDYQEKTNYNAILLDEEKKDIAAQLLRRVKISFNADISLYDKNGELIAFVYKDDKGYKLNFISYENQKVVLYSKYEFDDTYKKGTFKDGERTFLYQHIHYYDQPLLQTKTLITYHFVNESLYIKSHKSLFDKNSDTLAHIEMSYKIDGTYFKNISSNLNMNIFMTTDVRYSNNRLSLLDRADIDDVNIMQSDMQYYSSFVIVTKELPLNIVVSLDKSVLNSAISKNRKELILFLLLITSLTLIVLYFLLNSNLSKPLNRLMKNIFKIEKGDYSESKIIKSSDELEEISVNINRLANAVSNREKELKESQGKLEYLSNHDELTSLLNRRAFDKKLNDFIDLAKAKEHKAALLFLDLDQFKQVNDTLGHNVGDELLQKVSERLSGFLSEKALFARVGGDEFKIFIEDFENIKYIEELADDLLKQFEKVFVCGDYEISTTVSIGVAIYPDDGTDSVTLIKNADLAMYKSKDKGRNNYSFFSTELSEYLQKRTDIINALKYSLKNKDEFLLLYQPKISIKTGKIIGAEALIRWNSATLGFVRPDQFIGVAEDTHMIIEIGKWVLDQACKDFVQLKSEGYKLGQVSVNISAVQLKFSDLLETLQDVIKSTGIETRELELEVTESYIASNELKAIETLGKFRKLGIELAIDDFGTGYSSMSYLQKLPITRLKIDKAFVDDLPHSNESEAIVKAILALASTFGLKVTIEGVENCEQLDFFKGKYCDDIQGYVYSKPLPLDELKVFIKNNSKSATVTAEKEQG
ncbi:EAL domain-containing protein [bacterium]|nr:EAL domain-containing protein [bacterium]MBU1883130.1 EAL domain-containing protein [bacterium]